MHRFLRIAGVLALGLIVAAHPATSHAAALVQTSPAQFLVDGKGMTLYVYAPDPKGKSVCYGECAEYWPPMTVAKGTMIPKTMAGIMGTFGTTMRKGGKLQLTFDGAPLYRFVKDKKPGDMTGQGLDVAGGYWWMVVVPHS